MRLTWIERSSRLLVVYRWNGRIKRWLRLDDWLDIEVKVTRKSVTQTRIGEMNNQIFTRQAKPTNHHSIGNNPSRSTERNIDERTSSTRCKYVSVIFKRFTLGRNIGISFLRVRASAWLSFRRSFLNKKIPIDWRALPSVNELHRINSIFKSFSIINSSEIRFSPAMMQRTRWLLSQKWFSYHALLNYSYGWEMLDRRCEPETRKVLLRWQCEFAATIQMRYLRHRPMNGAHYAVNFRFYFFTVFPKEIICGERLINEFRSQL